MSDASGIESPALTPDTMRERSHVWDFVRRLKRRSGAWGVLRLLTDRQAEYLRRYCRGESRDEILAGMGVSYATLQSFRAKIRVRLNMAPIEDICRLLNEEVAKEEKADANS